MGKVKDMVADLEDALNPTHEQVVMYQDADGWYDWISAEFWDDPRHEHYRNTRTEIGRFDELYELLAARDAFNQMMHGQTRRTCFA